MTRHFGVGLLERSPALVLERLEARGVYTQTAARLYPPIPSSPPHRAAGGPHRGDNRTVGTTGGSRSTPAPGSPDASAYPAARNPRRIQTIAHPKA